MTVYVTDPADELPLERGIRFDLPQWTIRGLDPSFFEDLQLILAGRNRMQALDDFRNGRATEKALERVAAAIPIPVEHAVHLYACADGLCALLAALDEQRAADIAKRHRYLLWPSPEQEQREQKEPYRPDRFRVPTLMRLATLAQEAKRSARKLRVRVDYRRCTRDTTGRMSGSEPTRH